MLKEGVYDRHQYLASQELLVSTSGEVLTLVKNTNAKQQYIIVVKLLKTGERSKLKNTEVTTHNGWGSH